jgi:hypothetical protein
MPVLECDQVESEVMEEGDVLTPNLQLCPSAAGDNADAAVHRPAHWPVMCLPASDGEKQRDALQVSSSAQALERCVGGQLVLAQGGRAWLASSCSGRSRGKIAFT